MTASSLLAAALLIGCAAVSVRAADLPAATGAQLLRSSCGGCHQQSTPDQYARISSIRKTPEGWLMTIFRMQHVHGVALGDDDRDTLVRYLADTQGLAPSETTPARFALERRPNAQDMQLPGELQTLCARCHTAARVALQRRDADDWLKHVHWHLAQWPTIEYQQNARDRYWWQTASTVVPGELGKLFPFHSQAWDDWRKHAKADISGNWMVRGHKPGRGDYWGTAVIRKSADGNYEAAYLLEDEVGEKFDGGSTAIVYTGYEWRGSGHLGRRPAREVFALSEDGQTLSGRWFAPDHSEDGGDWTATRAANTARILAVSPTAIRVGRTTRVTLFGEKLDGAVNFGAGTKSKIVSRTPNSVVADVTVAAAAKTGYRPISVGTATTAAATAAAATAAVSSNPNLFAVYDRVSRLDVTPGFGIARLGGGKVDAVTAQYEAVAYLDLPTSAGGTEAVRLGNLPVNWSVEPFNEDAKIAQDVKFAGKIDDTGRFVPAGAGPNPERKFSANNAGNLSVVATLADNAQTVVGKGRLIVTVQRWNSPPIY
jgi:quinohemoprotein amine dehydrogenase